MHVEDFVVVGVTHVTWTHRISHTFELGKSWQEKKVT